MAYLNLLNRQIKRYIPEGENITEPWQQLLDAVNRSYEHYERDHSLAKQSLEISSEELQQLANELANKQARLHAVLGAASDGILVVNQAGQIELANHAAERFIAQDNNTSTTTSNKLIGKNVANIAVAIPNKESENELLSLTLQQIFQSGPKESLQELLLKQGNSFLLPVELSLSQVKLDTAEGVTLGILRDISQRKESEKKIAVRHTLTHQLFEATNLEEGAKYILEGLCQELGQDVAIFWLADSEEMHFSPTFSCCPTALPYLKELLEKTLDMTLPIEGYPSNVQWKTDFSQMARANELRQCGLQSGITIPLRYEKKLLGLVELFTRSISVRDEEWIKILSDIAQEIGLFIAHEKTRERELNWQKQLVTAARQAGMMEVANSVLHNVGNALNTVNISAGALQEQFHKSELDNLPKIAKMIEEHKQELAHYITTDPRGQLLPDFLITLGQWWLTESQRFHSEIKLLIDNIQHIKDIIQMQQSMSGLIGLKENISVNNLLDNLINIHSKEFERHKISVKKEFSKFPELYIDRAKLLQILQNLVRNAIDALIAKEIGPDGANEAEARELIVRTCLYGPRQDLCIEVQDNGLGISEANKQKIFSYGFTTKKQGHGFGLHSSALIAKELGGNLSVQSRGIGLGATFTCILPIGSRLQE